MIGVFFCLFSWISAIFVIIIDKREENRRGREEEKGREWEGGVGGGGIGGREGEGEGTGKLSLGLRRKVSFQERIKLVPNSPRMEGSLAEKYEIIKEISQRSIY